MQTKSIDINIPEYLTIEQYRKMNDYNGDTDFGRMIHAISSMSGEDFETVKKWPLSVIKEISSAFADLADHKHEFHSIIEWNGQLLGYSPIQHSTLGEYVDIENLSKDLAGNMHKLAAILYRPITKHRFKSFKFAVKQKVKMVANDVENVFDWYSVEPYDTNVSKSNILTITGDKSITDINFITVLNYLEIDKDFNSELQKIEKKQLQLNRRR